MTLVTQIERDGANVRPEGGWDWWHVQCMLKLAGDQCPEEPRVLQDKGEFVVRNGVAYQNPVTGQVIEFYTGDILRMWRETR